MARVLGEGGRYCRQQARRTERAILILGCVAIGLLAWISGFACSSAFRTRAPLVSFLTTTAALAAAVITYFTFNRRLDILAKQRDNLRKGETGEISIANLLTELPHSYFVINGLTIDEADIDHIVVGPTGLFAIDTKAWTGTVTADCKGELIKNGAPTDKPEVNNFHRRVIDLRKSIKALSPKTDFYVKALFVFTCAYVQARWGTTQNVYCMPQEQLIDHILNNKPRDGTISRSDTKKIARAIKALAYMDPNFPQVASADQSSKPTLAPAASSAANLKSAASPQVPDPLPTPP
jgi:hypothetical protein